LAELGRADGLIRETESNLPSKTPSGNYLISVILLVNQEFFELAWRLGFLYGFQ